MKRRFMDRQITKIYLILGIVLFTGLISNSFAQYSPNYKQLRSNSLLQDKTYYLLTSFEQLPEVRSLLRDDSQLNEITQQKRSRIDSVLALIEEAQDTPQFQELNISTEEIAQLFKFSKEQINSVEKDLLEYLRKEPIIKSLVDNHLRPSGKFQLFAGHNDAEFLSKAWRHTAEGINQVIDIYALGKGAQYPAIDSASYNVHDEYYRTLLTSMSLDAGNSFNEEDLFFQPSLTFVLKLLEANRRDEAARFEPLEALENKKAFRYIPNISWDDYSYSVVLIPGYGTLTHSEQLSPKGIIRCNLAAQRYKQDKAPLIILSGGNVHPFQVKYNEAIEMKKYLMENHAIPEKVIIIEPHARHTTTNFRNASRLMHKYEIPTEKKALVTTAIHQSNYITSELLKERSKRDLGYVPFELIQRISVNDVEFLPRIESMHADPIQPLDP